MGIFDRDFKPVLAVALHLKMHKLTIGEKVGAATCRYHSRNTPFSFLAVALHLNMHKLTIGEKVGAATCRYSTIFSISFCKASVKSKL
jgi:hypothetical protein